MTALNTHCINWTTSFFKTFLAALVLCAASLLGQTPSFISFDAPDAGTGDFQGTVATCINSAGAIGGSYTDSNNRVHGFVRNPSGVITEFDVPQLFGTLVVAINSRGDVVGQGNNRNGFQGFLRTANGRVVQITPPGATNLVVLGINDSAQITGYWVEISGIEHSFIRQADGTTPFSTIPMPVSAQARERERSPSITTAS